MHCYIQLHVPDPATVESRMGNVRCSFVFEGLFIQYREPQGLQTYRVIAIMGLGDLLPSWLWQGETQPPYSPETSPEPEDDWTPQGTLTPASFEPEFDDFVSSEGLSPSRSRSRTLSQESWYTPLITPTSTLRGSPTPPHTPIPDPDDYLEAFRPRRAPRPPRYLPDTPTKSHRPPERKIQKRKPKAFRCPNCKCRITITRSGHPSQVFQPYQPPPAPESGDEDELALPTPKPRSALPYQHDPRSITTNYWRVKEQNRYKEA